MTDIVETVEVAVKPKKKSVVASIRKVAMRETLVSDDRISEYADVMKDGYTPIFIPLVSALELGMFIFYCLKYEQISLSQPVPVNSIFAFTPDTHGEVWRFFTYWLVHSGAEHVAATLLFQLVIGNLMEMVHGPVRVMTIYFAGIIAGSLSTAVFDPNVFLSGASAGVYALLAAYLANIIMNWSEMDCGFRTVRLLVISIYSTLDLGMALYRRYYVETGEKTACTAHIFGAFAGFLIAVVILKNLKKKEYEKVLFWICLWIYITFDLVLVIIYVTQNFVDQDD